MMRPQKNEAKTSIGLYAPLAPMNILYKFYSLPYFLDATLRLGCEAVELWGGAPHLDIEGASPEDIRGIKRLLEGRGLRVCCLTPETGLYPVNIASEDKEMRRLSEAYLSKALDIAAELGSPVMQATSGTGYFDARPDGAWARSAEGLGRLSAKAEALGVDLALEALPRHESNLVYDATTIGRMLDEVGAPALGVLLDTSAAAAAGDTPELYIRKFGSRIKHIQLIDGPDGRLAWGDGCLPLESYAASIAASGYEGALGLELYAHSYYEKPDPVLERCVQALCIRGGSAAL
ncbi:sugar phosphate isomerase/epimerase family protein [Paenibacillus sp. 1P07SE]|uniref:sugar phosphate isomerase/epimerase family protein n=1 Tax=Paenibacillus sp. 1P07SE TaxID=3132209 RepID=UPI0039A4572B